jgi:hypothetical protein
MSKAYGAPVGRRLFMGMSAAFWSVAGLIRKRPAAAADASVASVAKLRGQALASRGGKNVMLAEGTPLQVGDALRTGPDSRMKIRFLDGSTATLGENSKLDLDQARFDQATGSRDIAATLIDGIVRCVVAKAAAGSRFQVSSSLVTSAARSTEWIVSVKDRTTSLLVLDGVVRAQGIGQTLTDLPSAPVNKGVDLKVHDGIAVGEPARSLGMKTEDMGRVIQWKQPRIDKLVGATDL